MDAMERQVLERVEANWEQQLDANKQAFALKFVQRAEFLATCRRHIAAIMDELGATSRFQAS